MDHRKNIVGFSGRILEEKAKQAKYINTPETLVYHKRKTLYGLVKTADAIRRENTVIITEGEFDVLSSFQAGVSNIVAVKGSGLTEEQLRLLARYAGKIIFALDADKAGDKAIRRGVVMADEKGLDVRIIPLKGGKDPDEIIQNDPLLWRKLVKKPIIYFDYVIESAINRYGTKSSHAKDEIIKDLAQFFAISKSPIVKAHYARKLAADLDLPEDVVVNAIEQEEKRIIISGHKYTHPTESEKKRKAGKKKRWQLLEEHILSILLQSQTTRKHLELLEGIISLDNIPMSAAAKILRLLKEYARKYEKFKVSNFIKTLDKELIPVADKAYMADIKNFDGDTKNLSLELRRSGRELQALLLKAELKKLTDKLKKLERKSGKKSQVNKLNKKITEVTRKIRVVL
jgi:DNA primase